VEILAMPDQLPPSGYIHGTDPEEQNRLTVLNRLINEACLRELALRGGERVLDVGSGLAQFTRRLGRAAGPAGRVIGVEANAEQLAEAVRQARQDGEETLVELRPGDALALPLGDDEWGTFDVVHTRFLLEHVRDPAAVVRQMARAVRPGGRIVLADDDHDVLRLWPEPPGVWPIWQAYVRTYDRLGHDPYVGRRLVQLLHEAGADPVRNTWLFFGSCAGQATFDVVVQNLIGILDGARETMQAQGLLDRDGFEQGLAALRAWGRRPDAAFWFAICWAEGRRRVP
jgi:ubiquinone/menaquinone biosynthesis C-methylase UbiE